jgi:tetratricopeptide (TPR) repeat protein
LDADPSPMAQRQATIGLIRLAQAEDDPVAAVFLAHQLAAQAEATSGPDSVAAAFAHLDLIEILLAAGKHVPQPNLDDTLRIILAQDTSWHVALRAARLQGQLAAQTGRFDEATAAFQRAETIARQNEGLDNLNIATEVSNQASVRLRAGDAAAADKLFRKALHMAAPEGDWHNATWARIADEAATAAERTGDPKRALQLHHDADELIPSVTRRAIIRWL